MRGATQFAVNGFEVDTRQVSPIAPTRIPSSRSPSSSSRRASTRSRSTPRCVDPGRRRALGHTLAKIPVDVQAQPTEKFTAAVQEQVESFLSTCATQQVLQPTGCPFGLVVQNRLASTPTWSIAQQPTVTLVPDGAHWRIEKVPAVAHITVDIRSIFDGSVRTLDEAVPFSLDGTVTILPDGTASIQVGDGS